MPLPSYLRTHRKRWALSESELGHLLGVSASAISKYETLKRQPSAEVVLGCEFIFSTPADEIFTAASGVTRAAIVLNAKSLRETLQGKGDQKTQMKLKLIDAIIARVEAELDA